MDRMKQLGNAVVPQIPEMIGKALIEFDRRTQERM
jgi:site-specific DNA-cytosine methylase